MGHEVRLCAGEVDALRTSARLVPPMHFTWPPAARVTAAAFDPEQRPARRSRAEIDRLADLLVPVLEHWIDSERLELLDRRERVGHPDAPAAGRGAAAASWRRAACRPSATITTTGGSGSASPSCVVPDVLTEAFPPDLPNIRHVSIN